MKNRVLVWISGTDLIMNSSIEKQFIGGMQVQMYMWAKTFANNGWDVYTYTSIRNNHKRKIDDITYLYYPRIPILGPIVSLFYMFFNIVILNPSVTIINGATRDLYFVVIASKVVGTKVIEIFASDSDLEPTNELIKRKCDKMLYRKGIRATQYFVVQNLKQEILLQRNYKKKNYILAPSIWINGSNKGILPLKKDTILWVGNFRSLKRPEWFIELAKLMPNRKFIMVGNPTDQSLVDKCNAMIVNLSNIDLIPGLNFFETSKLFEGAHLFICTSEIEGFPNTFLQSWMNGCPVLSSFDPSDLIRTHRLGFYCSSIEDFLKGIERFDNPDFYRNISDNIVSYFNQNHSAETYFVKMLEQFMLS